MMTFAWLWWLGLLAGPAQTPTADPVKPVPPVVAPERSDVPGQKGPKGSAPEPIPHPYDDAKGVTPPSPAALLRAADEIARRVSNLRGLAIKRPLKRGVLDREAIRKHLITQIARQYTKEQIATEGKILMLLGLLPPDVDYEKLQLDLLMEQVAGFYDPYGKELYIASWLPTAVQAPALAHEIAHALADQHFDLKRFISPAPGESDRQLARSALVEGDGTGVMLEFTAGKDLGSLPDLSKVIETNALGGLVADMKVFQSAPPFLRAVLLFPYASGLRFVTYYRKRHPWTYINTLYRRPPVSTEQILHPEKLDKPSQRDVPRVFKTASLGALSDHVPVHEDTLGELQIRLFLQIVGQTPTENNPPGAGSSNSPSSPSSADAEDAAAGWAGDRLVAYRPKESQTNTPTALVWLIEWDTASDAAEFTKMATRAAERISASLEVIGDKRHLLLVGIPPEKRAAVTKEVQSTWKRR